MIFYLSFFFWAGVIFLIMFIFVLANTPRDKYTPEQVKQTQQKEQSERDVLALRCRMDNQNSYNLLVNESRRTGIPMPSFHPKLC
jgi:cytoskeletal protein RodZ